MQSLVIDRMEQNEELTAKVLHDEKFQGRVAHWLGEEVNRRLRESGMAGPTAP